MNNDIFNKAKRALKAFADHWKEHGLEKNRGNTALQTKLRDSSNQLARLQLSRITGRNGSATAYSTEILNLIREFLNNNYPSIGHIDDNWIYTSYKRPITYYSLYYPKDEQIVRCFTEVSLKDKCWDHVKYTLYREQNGILEERSSFSYKEGDSIKTTSDLIYLTLSIDSYKLNEHKHNYVFKVKSENLATQNYIFGTFSRVSKDDEFPSAGVCLLNRLSDDKLKALEEFKKDISPEIIATLYKRRVDLTSEECSNNLSTLPLHRNIENFKEYSGTWQGVHLDSELYEQKGYLRTFSLRIEPSGIATLTYSDSESGQNNGQHVSGFFTPLDNTKLYAEFNWDKNKSLSRIIMCLTRSDEDFLVGSYGGYSAHKELPYSGAITLKKVKSAEIMNVQKNKQDITNHGRLIQGLNKAYREFVNMPERCLSKPLLAMFNDEDQNISNIEGYFRTFSFSSEKNALVSYPIWLKQGMCYVYGRTKEGKDQIFHGIINRGHNNHVWLEFDTQAQAQLTFYCGGGDFGKMENLSGLSLRVNSKGKLQAKRELLIREERLTKFQVFKYGTTELMELLSQDKYQCLKSLLGREFSMIQLSVSDKIDDHTKRRDFVDIYLTYAVKQYLEKNELWKLSLEQSILHGAILDKLNFVDNLKHILRTFKNNDIAVINDFIHMYETVSKSVSK